MLTAIVKEGDTVVCMISSCDEDSLDAKLAEFMNDDREVEISGEPEPPGHNAPSE